MTLHDDEPVEVGVRELHDRLSHYLRLATGGTEVTVTMRGRPVARLLDAAGSDPLADLRRRGLVSPGRRNRRTLPRTRPRASRPVSDLVSQQRR